MGWVKRWDIWGVVIGVLGICVAVYTYIATSKVGRISYAFDTQKVFDPNILSGFTLINASKEPITASVYATDFVLWNSGSLSLGENSDRLREPIKVSLEGTIHYFILNKTNVVEGNNYRIAIGADKKSIVVSWKYFDPSQGIRLAIIHSDTASPKVLVSGRFFEADIHEETIQKVRERPPVYLALFGVIFASLGLVIIFGQKYISGTLQKSAPKWQIISWMFDVKFVRFIGGLAIVEGVFIVSIAMYFNYFLTVPPV